MDFDTWFKRPIATAEKASVIEHGDEDPPEYKCRCGKWGPANYGIGGPDEDFYCGGSDRCIP